MQNFSLRHSHFPPWKVNQEENLRSTICGNKTVNYTINVRNLEINTAQVII